MRNLVNRVYLRLTTQGTDAGKGWTLTIVSAAIVGVIVGLYARSKGLGPFHAQGK